MLSQDSKSQMFTNIFVLIIIVQFSSDIKIINKIKHWPEYNLLLFIIGADKHGWINNIIGNVIGKYAIGTSIKRHG